MSIVVRGLCASYGHSQVLWDVGLEVGEGEVVGVFGRNGAGKTTLLRSLSGVQPNVRGSVRLGGVETVGVPADRIARQGISVLRESGKCASSLTVLNHLALGQRLGRLRGKPPLAIDEVWRWFPLLEPLKLRKAGLLSGGQRQALALAVAFVSQPRWMLLDEPSAGLAPPVARDLFETIGQLAATGVTIVVVEQHPAWLEGIATTGHLLEVGRIVRSGPLEQFLASARAGQAA